MWDRDRGRHLVIAAGARDGEGLRWKWETVRMPEEEAYVRTQEPIGRANIVGDGSDAHFDESG
jgi:hypothetical protein